jgi:phosphoribosylformimino-5-aminoimidazole carboxamide ribotide isomerase
MLSRHPDIRLIASGGISTIADLVLLRDLGCYAAIVGKAIYEQRITLSQIQTFMQPC